MRLKQLGLAVIVVVWGCGDPPPHPTAGKALPPKRIILVTIDTWRSDALSASGSGKVKTPNLDAFAVEGLYCPRAWSSATLTAPSHATILTGLQPFHHGVRDNHGFRLSPSARTLAGALREYGYATAAFVSAHPLARISGLDAGFATYDDHCPPGDLLSVSPRARAGSETIEAARVWIGTAPERFFLWVHLYEPHDPYLPPEPYRSDYKAAPYYGEVAFADELVGRLKRALGAAGEKDALWIVCGDHGEALGDHGESTHSLFVYDATARVPLIFWCPGLVRPARSSFARLVDIVPTVLSLAGFPLLAETDGRVLVGDEGTRASGTAYVETLYPYLNFGAAPVRALTDGRTKVIDVPDREVYDLDADPAEARNLAGGKRLVGVDALWQALAALPAALPTASRAAGDDAEALKSLGYIGSGGEYGLARGGMDPKAFAPLYRKINLVHELCGGRRWTEAMPIYRELLASFPRSSVLLAELGLVEMAAGRGSDAEAHLRSALDRNPNNTHALLGLANLELARGDFKATEQGLLHILRLDPDDVEANFDLGALYHQNLGQPAKAIPYWQKFLELQPEDREAPRIRKLVEDAKK